MTGKINYLRGFRRIGWVIIGLSAVPVVYLSFQEATEFTGYSTKLIPSSHEELESLKSSHRTTVDIPNVGLVAFPTDMTTDEITNSSARLYDDASKKIQEKKNSGNSKTLAPTRRLIEERRKQLDDIVMKMDAEGQAGEKIRAAVEEFKKRHEDEVILGWETIPVHQFTREEVHRVNKVKFVGFSVLGVLLSVLLVQGSISIMAWIFRGFKPTT